MPKMCEGVKSDMPWKQNRRPWPEFPSRTEKGILPMTEEVVYFFQL